MRPTPRVVCAKPPGVTLSPNRVLNTWATFASGTPGACAARRPRRRPRGRTARWQPPTHRRSAARVGPQHGADTASSGRPRCRSGVRWDVPPGGLPGTASPRAPPRPRRRSRDTSPEPMPSGARRPAPDAGGILISSTRPPTRWERPKTSGGWLGDVSLYIPPLLCVPSDSFLPDRHCLAVAAPALTLKEFLDHVVDQWAPRRDFQDAGFDDAVLVLVAKSFLFRQF